MWKHCSNNLRRGGVIALLLSALLLTGCGDDTPREELLRATLETMEAAAREKDADTIMEHVSEDYLDDQGRRWQDIGRIVRFEFFRHRTVHLYKLVRSLELADEDHASAAIMLAVAGQPIESVENLATVRADLMRIDVRFRYDDVWQVTSATWQRATLADFLP